MSAAGGPGWRRFPADPRTLAWARAARVAGQAALADPALRARWLVCEGTWFVGVDALPNGPDGALSGVPLAGPAIDALAPLPPLHRAQLSVTFPGYPRPREGEGAAGFGYRLRRDAAHVDGIRAEGPERRRFLREPHAFILGLPLNAADPGASPLVVWEGSHHVMAKALLAALAARPDLPPDQVDVTEAYLAARRQCFETCRRVELPARPGEALLLHRLVLHGVAPWAEGARAGPEGRMIAYFRPELSSGLRDWLSDRM
ncbi:hypothetical protein AVJ23_19760 [Pseudoponticoccus marisrubri]|uniref:Phytanoyl-CoA dioxygenase n=1 Tax=Pseudoponticoccus marisrubri TaxID=1685382 RepID=A0A0W7WEZ6_9RHOB|nr:hypothetical protein [Pseudoponticoccus marisrubri]KUF09054.1 hypothetical protein AVJ23_19760 [Pseudoponticoccus marisrubri]